MSLLPIFVLADDLTGAAEMAAIAHTAGLRAVVYTTLPADPVEADVAIFDTDTRLVRPAEAARRVRAFVHRLKELPHDGFFKKTDSVLRGPVLAELTACASALGLGRTLLVPSNPSLGRIIKEGHYFISGRPINATAFASDPHHPRRTSDVLALLGAAKPYVVTCLPASSRTPPAGIVVGEASSPAHVIVWAGQVDKDTLPAGGADFFRVWLHSRRAYREPARDYELPKGPALLINGTIAAPEPLCPFPAELLKVDARQPPAVSSLVPQLRASLAGTGFAAVTTAGPVVHKTLVSTALTRTFVQIARQLHASGDFRHVLVAGGATASAVLDKLGWTQFEAVHVWGPGVVTLQPSLAPGFLVTMKPGSYQWPARLSAAFADSEYAHPHEQPAPHRADTG